jgi:hypothetical protein
MKMLLTAGMPLRLMLAALVVGLAGAAGPAAEPGAPPARAEGRNDIHAAPTCREPAADAAGRLIRRLLPGRADQFIVEIIPPRRATICSRSKAARARSCSAATTVCPWLPA